MDNTENIPYKLLVKYFEGLSSKGEVEKLLLWKSRAPENLKEFKMVEKIYHKGRDTSFNPDTEKALQKVLSRLPEQKKKINSPGYNWLRIAAVLLLGIGISFAVYWSGKRDAPEMIVFVNHKSKTTKLELPDGSVVWLRKGGKIIYPAKFPDKLREIQFSGEGYFEIAPQARQAFIIEAGRTKTEVLGTKFSLNTANADSSVVLILDEGLVSFKYHGGLIKKTVKVKAGEKAICRKENHEIVVSGNDDLNHAAWKTHRLTFHHATVFKIVSDMEKFYGIQFGDIPDTLGQKRLVLTLDSFYTIEHAIDNFKFVLEKNIVKEGKIYYIQPDS
jgi:ferric-dicitrate binding protein FerR (iron transport regulator)